MSQIEKIKIEQSAFENGGQTEACPACGSHETHCLWAIPAERGWFCTTCKHTFKAEAKYYLVVHDSDFNGFEADFLFKPDDFRLTDPHFHRETKTIVAVARKKGRVVYAGDGRKFKLHSDWSLSEMKGGE